MFFVLVRKLEETKTGREQTYRCYEFPYMVNKTKVHEHIKALSSENVSMELQLFVMNSTVKVFAERSKLDATHHTLFEQLIQDDSDALALVLTCLLSKMVFQRF